MQVALNTDGSEAEDGVNRRLVVAFLCFSVSRMALWDLSIEELRGLASQKGFSPYYEDDGVRKPLSSEDLRNMLTRLALREKGLELYSYRDLEAGCSPSARQHTFWSDKDASTWDSCTHLPNYAQVGLFSKLAVGYDVVLWTYHPSIDGLPPAQRII